jgi:hypothetical protein
VGGAAGTLAWTCINVSKILRLDQVVANARDTDGVVHLLPDIPRGARIFAIACACQELTISTDCALIRRSSWPAGGYPIPAETCGSR